MGRSGAFIAVDIALEQAKQAVVAGSTEIPVELFEAKLMKWRQPRSETGTTSIQTQFEVY